MQALGAGRTSQKISDRVEEDHRKKKTEIPMRKISDTGRRNSRVKPDLKSKSMQEDRRGNEQILLTRSQSCSGQQHFLLQSSGSSYDSPHKYNNRIKRSQSTVFDIQNNSNKREEEDFNKKKRSSNSTPVGGTALRRIKTFLRRSGKYEC